MDAGAFAAVIGASRKQVVLLAQHVGDSSTDAHHHVVARIDQRERIDPDVIGFCRARDLAALLVGQVCNALDAHATGPFCSPAILAVQLKIT